MITLRQKAEYLWKLGISSHYFKLLLKQKKIADIDKKIIEDLYKAVK